MLQHWPDALHMICPTTSNYMGAWGAGPFRSLNTLIIAIAQSGWCLWVCKPPKCNPMASNWAPMLGSRGKALGHLECRGIAQPMPEPAKNTPNLHIPAQNGANWPKIAKIMQVHVALQSCPTIWPVFLEAHCELAHQKPRNGNVCFPFQSISATGLVCFPTK